jgi:hypothetical protein
MHISNTKLQNDLMAAVEDVYELEDDSKVED